MVMAMPNFLVKTVHSSDTNLPSDAITNTLVVSTTNPATQAMYDQIVNSVAAFYNTPPPSNTKAVKDFLSPVLSNVSGQSSTAIYDLTGKLAEVSNGVMPLMGSPVDRQFWTLSARTGTATPLPSEVAYVATLETLGRAGAAVETADAADFGVERDRPKQRNTGRIYLGPLNSDAVAVVNGIARPATDLRDTVRRAFQKLFADLNASPALGSIMVWSRKDGAARAAFYVSLDDSFDTQRRRGEAPSVRDRYTL